jgi:hypothetical protein
LEKLCFQIEEDKIFDPIMETTQQNLFIIIWGIWGSPTKNVNEKHK